MIKSERMIIMLAKRFVAVIFKASSLFNILSMSSIFLVAFIIFMDILLRLAIKTSILGAYEITEMAMIIVIFGSLAHTQFLKGHVRVTMFVERMRDRAKKITEGSLLIVTSAVSAIVSYSSFVQAAVYYEKDATTAVLKMPYFPFAYIMAIGLTLFTIMLFMDAVKIFSKASDDKIIKIYGENSSQSITQR
jgi:TRAP-type C4-dicarboxylate transport system permease small subunit